MNRIILENITFGYSKESMLFENLNIDFFDEFNCGYVYALMGSSGSGKTTILKLVLRLLETKKGSIVTKPSKNPVISYIPQEPVLFEHLTPLQNATFFKSLHTYQKIFDKDRFVFLAELMGMNEILKSAKDIGEMSGGEKQRLAILRALSIKPDILLFDEPLTGLDAESKSNILILLRNIVKQYKLLVIYVTHHFTEAQLIADEIVYISRNYNNNSVYKKSINDFFNYPPVLESAISIAFPDYTVLPITIKENNIIELVRNHNKSSSNEQVLFLFITSENITFSEDKGFPVDSIIESSQFAFINLANDSSTVKVIKNKAINSSGYIEISGEGLIYNSKKVFQRYVQIRNNQIIN